MAQLDERTRGDLARLRARAAPSEATKQRMFAALEVELGDPEGSDGEGGPDDPIDVGDLGQTGSLGGQLGYAAKVVGATLGMTGAGLLAVRVGVGIVRALASEPLAPASDSPNSAPTQPAVIAAGPQLDDGEEIAIDPPGEPRAVDAAPKLLRPSPARARAPEQTDTLAEELALLEAARAARDPAAALIELERHLARFPRGSLAVERELLRVEVLCRLDRLDEARTLGDRLAQRNAVSRDRLSAACAELSTRPPPE